MSQSGNEQSLFGAWPGFLVAFLLTVGAVWVQTPFKTERPPEPKAGLAAVGVQDVDARLWQDPFAAVDEARKGGADGPHHIGWLAGQIDERATLKESEAKASEAKESPASPAIQVLAILVDGGPSAGAAERRRRDRYAVLSGLMLEGFLPHDAEHVGYFIPPDCPPDYIPFEWFWSFEQDQPNNERRQELLLLWIDQEGLRRPPKPNRPPSAEPPAKTAVLSEKGEAASGAHPPGEDQRDESRLSPNLAETRAGPRLLTRLSALFGKILGNSRAEPGQIRFSVIGPRDSTALMEISDESALFSKILGKSRAEPDQIGVSVVGPRDSTARMGIRDESALFSEIRNEFGSEVRFVLLPRYSTALMGISDKPAWAQGLGPCSKAVTAQMWSPFATIPEDRMQLRPEIQSEKWVAHEPLGVCVCSGAASCVGVLPPGPSHRTIADDAVLVDLLMRELERRYVGPNSGIALVGQWDTAYSRALASRFQAVWETKHDLEAARGDDMRIFRPSYMRGLDGAIPKAKSRDSGTSGASDKERGGESAKAIERADGDAQLDYLRRMRNALLAKDAELRSDCTPTQRFMQDCGIRAIGVLGNDYFDKLLVLKALKPFFPNAVFFTTDLDADMFHPRDNLVTRNLIVASGFGLTLRGSLQREIPPLRDSYQTSLLLAVRMALGSPKTKALQIPPPARLFEVGRTGPVELVDASQLDEEGFLRPAHPCSAGIPSDFDPHPRKELNAHFRLLGKHTGWAWLSPVALAAVLLLAGVLLVLTLGPDSIRRALRRLWRGLTSGWLPILVVAFNLAVLIALGVLAWQDIRGGGEPLSWIQGVSIWPAEVLRLIAGLAALVFLAIGHDRLCQARQQIEGDFGLGPVPPPQGTPAPGSPSQAAPAPPTQAADRPLAESAPAAPGPHEPPAAAEHALSSAATAAPSHAAASQTETDCGDLLSAPGGKPQTDRPPVSAALIWRCYMRGCRALPRWLGGKVDAPDSPSGCPKGWGSRSVLTRLVPDVILFFLLAQALMVAFGFPNRPVRSDLAWGIDLAVILLALIPFLGLLFYMVDATRQTLTLARDLAGPVLWTEENLGRFGLSRWSRSSSADAAEARDVDWLDVHLIARVTRPVGNLVWYPVLVLIVLALGRHSVFDAWGLPPALMAVMLVALLYVIGCAWALRLAAERVRGTALRNLSLARLRAQGTTGREACISQLDTLLKAVNEEREGAFRPFSQQPVVQALLTLASSVSGLALMQYSSLLNL